MGKSFCFLDLHAPVLLHLEVLHEVLHLEVLHLEMLHKVLHILLHEEVQRYKEKFFKAGLTSLKHILIYSTLPSS